MTDTRKRRSSKKIFEDHCIAFVDFLGFRNILPNSEKTSDILKILTALQASRTNFRIRSEIIDESQGRIEVRAAVSAFSDHVVISYPIERMYIDKGLNQQTVAFIVMDHLRGLIKDIAVAALNVGLLIRGGITIGQLYHHKGVVFGQAMVDAYRLESEVAIYPRVVLSSTLSGNPSWLTEDPSMVKRDFDGVYFLDYLHPMVMAFSPGGINWIEGLKHRMDVVRQTIRDNTSGLERSGKLKDAAKWHWFGTKLEETLRALPQGILSDHGVTAEQLARLGLDEDT